MKVTITDIARKCNVSIGTVSGVLHDKANVKQATKERVREVMRQLNYIPYNNAELAKKTQTRSIGLVVPNLEYEKMPLMNTAVFDFKKELEETDFTSIIYSQKELKARLRKSRPGSTDGILADALVVFSYFGQDFLEDMQTMAAAGLPLVSLRRRVGIPGVPVILDNDYEAVSRLLEKLYAAGFRRFRLVTDIKNKNLAGRENAFRDFLETRGLQPVAATGFFNRIVNQGDQWCREEIQGRERTAVICSDDRSALKVMEVFRRNGIPVPDQAAVTGFNNSQAGELSTPSLTTVRIPVDQMMRLAIRLMEDLLDGIRPEASETVLADEVICRESTDRQQRGLPL